MAKRGIGFGVAGKNAETSFVYVGDLVDALIKLSGDQTNEHRTYYVSYPEPADNRTLWRALGSAQDQKVRIVPIPKARFS